MKVFLDANVLFSAADPASATRRLLQAVARHAEVITCPHAWEEARRNLVQKRPAHLDGLGQVGRLVTVSLAFCVPPDTALPACDVPILAGAIGAQCTHLWTSDRRHFGQYYGRDVAGVRVVSSLMLADEIIRLGWKV